MGIGNPRDIPKGILLYVVGLLRWKTKTARSHFLHNNSKLLTSLLPHTQLQFSEASPDSHGLKAEHPDPPGLLLLSEPTTTEHNQAASLSEPMSHELIQPAQIFIHILNDIHSK